MPVALPQDATVTDVLSMLKGSESYVCGMLGNLHACQRKHGNAAARIGITGGGKAPNYTIEFEREKAPLGIPRFKIGIVGIFDGRNHKLIEWIDDIAQEDGIPVKDEHWSNRSMTIDDLTALLGEIRAIKKGLRR